jgi:adenylate cyclase
MGQEYTRSLFPDDESGKKEGVIFQFLEFLPIGVFFVDSQGHPYYANQKAFQLLGKRIIGGTTPDHLAETYQA